MSLYKTFRTDEKVEIEGVTLEVNVGADKPPIKIRLARAGGANTKYARVREAKVKPYRRLLAKNELDERTVRRIYAEVYADSVVLGWENVTDENDRPLEFNRDNVIKVFTDLPELFEEVQAMATRIEPFKADISEETRGN